MIETERLILALLKPSDFNSLLEMYKEADAFKYIAPLRDKEDHFYLSFLEKKQGEIDRGNGYYWVIKNRSTQEMMGAINLTPIPNTERMQIGWQLKSAYHRCGYAYEAAEAALQYAIRNTDIDPIFAVFEVGNIASEKMIKRLGFKKLEERKEGNTIIETHIYQRD
jgi:ribosomal-protein-alanine N-acetyltransferase